MDATVAELPGGIARVPGDHGGQHDRSRRDRSLFDQVMHRLLAPRGDQFCTLNEAVTPAEVKALIHYASERGLDPQGHILVPLYAAVVDYDCAVVARDKDGVVRAGKDIIRHYTALSQITYADGVNGKTLQDARRVGRFMRTIIALGLIALTLGLFAEMLPLFEGWLRSSEMAMSQFLLEVHEQKVLVYLSPFFWGALGSCVFLLKKLSEKAAAHTFDSRKLQGTSARIFLGATFAGIVVNCLGLQSVTLNGESVGADGFTTTLTSSAVGFICGLGVKAVYGAFERVVDSVHDRIARLGRNRHGETADRTTRRYILERLAATPADAEPEKHKLLVQLLNDLRQQQPAA